MLVSALKERLADVEIDAVGGASMARSGANLIESHDRLGVMGLAEGIGTIPAHIRILSRLRRRFTAGIYNLVILVDYPGFHLRVAAAAAAAHVPVLYYVAPQLWAWGAWRVRSIRKHVRKMALVLPFEEPFFLDRGIPAEYVGHPLLDRDPIPSVEIARASLNLSDATPVLGLFPGSRAAEIRRIWPCFRDAAKILGESSPTVRVVVGAMQGLDYPGAPEFQFCRENSAGVLAASDAVLCKSGTITLEAALAGTPMVIAYKMHSLTYAVARVAVRVDRVGLVNLVAGRVVCPELLQSKATPWALARAVAPLLDRQGVAAATQREAFVQIRDRLGGSGATQRVAEMAARMVA